MSSVTQSWFENWIFNSFRVTKKGLGLYRIFTALFILFFMLPSPSLYAFLGTMPAQFYCPPPGPMMLFSAFPPAYIFLIFHLLLVIALLCLCLGFETKYASFAVGILLLTLKGFIFGVGKINHVLLLVIVPLVMAFSGWGQAYSLDERRRHRTNSKLQGWPITLLALILGFMMFTAGFPKILGGWFNIHTHAAYGYYAREFILRGRNDLLAPYGQHLGKAFWEIMDYATVLFEVSFIIAITNPKSTRIYVSLAILFHLGTMLFLNITFLPNFLAYAAFVNWSWVDRIIRRGSEKVGHLKSRSEWAAPAAILVAMGGVLFLDRLFSGAQLLESDWGIAALLFVCASVPIAVSFLVKTAYKALRS